MGLFYADWSATGYGRKIRVFKGLIESYDAAVDPRTGRLVVVAGIGNKIYFASRSPGGGWQKPAPVSPEITTGSVDGLSVQVSKDGSLVTPVPFL